jgi:cell division protein FtsA
MPDKLQNLSEKVIHIKSSSTEPDKQLPVKYLSEIITARVEEIMMAIIYEIQESGFADMLRSGIVVTGGSAMLPNLGAFINDLSGFKVRTGFPKRLFSCQDCEAMFEPSASASVGLILAACDNDEINCAHHSDVALKVEEPAADGNLFSNASMEEMVEKEPRPAPIPEKPKAPAKPAKKGVWKDKIGSFVGNIFDSVMNEVESDR